jgi:DNA adenine methylase
MAYALNDYRTVTKPKKKKIIAFGWYGGKYSHLNWLLPLLPEALHYCEPFGGSAAVLLNRKPSPVETYNELDGEITNFFKVLRDQKEELIYSIGMTPFSRREFRIAIETENNGEAISDLERARRFFIRARQVRTGLAQTATVGRWANCLKTSRAGMAGAVSRWLGSVEGLEYIASRLLRVQIENENALDVIKRYDSKETFFYCDPPYIHDSRGDKNAYKYEMTDEDHRKLAKILKKTKGKVALSGYRCTLMDRLYGNWNMHVAETKKALSVKSDRTEILWTNY